MRVWAHTGTCDHTELVNKKPFSSKTPRKYSICTLSDATIIILKHILLHFAVTWENGEFLPLGFCFMLALTECYTY